MSDMDKSTSVNFDELLRETANKVYPLLQGDSTTGHITGPKDFFVNNLPENIPVETYVEVMNYRDLMTNAVNLAFVEKSVELYKENKDLKRTDYYMPTIGRSCMEGATLRDYMRPDKEGGQVPGVGKLAAVSYTDYSSRGPGELKSIKKHFGELAAKHLSD